MDPSTEELFSQENVSRAFTEWERRYREEPERFQSEAAKLLKETPETYGQACAPYFLQIIGEVTGMDAREISPPAAIAK